MTLSLSIVIPTYRREAVLVATLKALLELPDPADEIVVVDQTPSHEEETERALGEWERRGAIRRVKLPRPSIPHAMNVGLLEARSEIILFVDDDIVPGKVLVPAHREAHAATGAAVVAGQVLQPGEEPFGVSAAGPFRFCSSRPEWIEEFIGCNFSVTREGARGVGGFDENFVGGGYRYERDFSRRILASGGRIYFEPRAGIHHLRAPHGGTRSYGDHLRSVSPAHSVGEYYDFFKWSPVRALPAKMLGRMSREIRTRHHLRHPWWIPVTLAAEAGGLFWALGLFARGPRLLNRGERARAG